MFLLDTNVISELRRASNGKANPNVVKWAEQHKPSTLFISVITLMELETGILLVERKDKVQGEMLRKWFEKSVKPAFSKRILPLDDAVAIQCAKLHVPDRKSERDAIIAATALTHKLTVVTRNADDFRLTGVEIINPWGI